MIRNSNRRTPTPKEQLTLYACAKCGAYLNTTEAHNGDTCVKCLLEAKDRAYQIKHGTAAQNKAVADMLAKWKDEFEPAALPTLPCEPEMSTPPPVMFASLLVFWARFAQLMILNEASGRPL